MKSEQQCIPQCGRPYRERSWMWNLFCTRGSDRTVGPWATNLESVKIWTTNISLLWESSSAKVTGPSIPSFIKDALGIRWKEVAFYRVLSHVVLKPLSVKSVDSLSSGSRRPCKWPTGPVQGWSFLEVWTWARRLQKAWEWVDKVSTVKESPDRTSGTITQMAFWVVSRASIHMWWFSCDCPNRF